MMINFTKATYPALFLMFALATLSAGAAPVVAAANEKDDASEVVHAKETQLRGPDTGDSFHERKLSRNCENMDDLTEDSLCGHIWVAADRCCHLCPYGPGHPDSIYYVWGFWYYCTFEKGAWGVPIH